MIKTFLSLILILSLTACSRFYHQYDNKLIPTDFITDGCTMFPDQSALKEEDNWKHCCVAHDMEYWIGGDQGQKNDADQELKQCVVEVKDSGLGPFMEFFVKIGGTPQLPSSWAWGYGHPAPFEYHELSKQERQAIASKLHTVLLEFLIKKDEYTPKQLEYLISRFDNRLNQDYKDVISNRDLIVIEKLKEALTRKVRARK